MHNTWCEASCFAAFYWCFLCSAYWPQSEKQQHFVEWCRIHKRNLFPFPCGPIFQVAPALHWQRHLTKQLLAPSQGFKANHGDLDRNFSLATFFNRLHPKNIQNRTLHIWVIVIKRGGKILKMTWHFDRKSRKPCKSTWDKIRVCATSSRCFQW